MAHVQRKVQGDKVSWVVRHRLDDGRERAKSFERRDAARKFAAEVAAGVTPANDLGRAERFSAYAERWQKAQIHHAPATTAAIADKMVNHIGPKWGSRHVDSISRAEVQEWIGELHEHLAASTTETTLRMFAMVMNAAVLEGLIDVSPTKGVKLPKKRSRSAEVPDLDALAAIREALPPRHALPFDLMLLAGLRLGETCGLTLDRVDRDRGALVIDRQLLSPNKGPIELGPLKSRSVPRRVVPVPEVLIDRIDAQAEHGYAEGPIQTVVASAFLRPMRRSSLGGVFNAARKKAGATHVRPHDLRHAYAAALIRGGESVLVVQRRLGHASPTETLNTYGHLWQDSDESTRAAIEGTLGAFL